MEVTVAEDRVMDTALYVPCGMDCIMSGATVPRRCASSMVMGEAMVRGTLAPDVLVKLMALMVTAHSSTESEGVSPIFTSTAVDEAGGVTGDVVPEPEPPPHPIALAVVIARASNVHVVQLPAIDRFMVLLLINTYRIPGNEKIAFGQLLFITAKISMGLFRSVGV